MVGARRRKKRMQKGEREGGGPLRSGRAIKVFAHERVAAEVPDERRACKREKSRKERRGGGNLMPRRLARGIAGCPAIDDRQI